MHKTLDVRAIDRHTGQRFNNKAESRRDRMCLVRIERRPGVKRVFFNLLVPHASGEFYAIAEERHRIREAVSRKREIANLLVVSKVWVCDGSDNGRIIEV